jgi:sulfur carrier protein
VVSSIKTARKNKEQKMGKIRNPKSEIRNLKLVVNAKAYEHKGDGTLESLLQEMKVEQARVAIMVNDEVINKADRDTLTLKDGDRVEVLTFAGGG